MKPHKLFITQIIIAVIVFIGLSFSIKKGFYNDPKANDYLSFNDGVKKMALSSDKLIDSLIVLNDLTFDPSSGKYLNKVLNNLKYTEKSKLVLIGSSQLRTVQGDYSSYDKMVSRIIGKALKNSKQVYNLSLGGMTIPEKLIVAKKSSEILNPERYIISVTPWDCIADKVRPEVKTIENKKFTYLKKDFKKNKTRITVKSKASFPISLNDKITKALDNTIGSKLTIYNKRSAIQSWLKEKVENLNKESLISSKDNINKNLPEYWRTLNQELNNTTGWDAEIAYSEKKSIKILKTDPKKNAKWTGDDITLKQPTNTFEFEGWSKAENVSKNVKLYAIDFQVIFEDGTSKWHYKGLKFAKGTHDWQQVKTKVTFEKKVAAIKPHLLFYGGTGSVWFDDIKAMPIYNGKVSKNILPNSSFEEELKERVNVSYSYTVNEWDKIKNHAFEVVDFLANTSTKEKNVLLITPFWHSKNKTAYPQKKQYKTLLISIKKYCKEKNVIFIDASYILSKDNFGIYTKGSVRDKIDVLHFNADGHKKLANYIIKELKL